MGPRKYTRHKKEKVKTARGRKISSTNWIRRHINDPAVLEAKKLGYRSRAAFKLLDIDEKFGIFQRVQNCVVDLGSAPGSWLQVVVERVPKEVGLIGVDLKVFDEIYGVHLIIGDFTDERIREEVEEAAHQFGGVDLILSDMAAAACGDKETDHIRIAILVDGVLDFAVQNLEQDGNLVSKMLMGNRYESVLKKARSIFKYVKTYKSDVSYGDSAEIFLVALCKK